MICIIRNVRIGTLLKEIQIFKNLHEFCVKMTKPLLMMFVSMYFFFYCFAVLGNMLLGGKVTTSSAQIEDAGVPTLYYLLNFNDLASSIITLYGFMIISGWWVITNMYIDIVGSTWPIYFYIVFFITIELILLNLVIAVILEIYNTVEYQVDEYFKKIRLAKQVQYKYKDLDASVLRRDA